MKEVIMRILDKKATAKDYLIFVGMVMVAYALLKVSLNVVGTVLGISLQLIFYVLPLVLVVAVVVKVLNRKEK